jgi:hypothetical protein
VSVSSGIVAKLERDAFLQQQIETELIATRLFRFRARRGIGVFYSIISIVPMLGIILYLTVPLLLVVSGIVVAYFAVWYIARLCGFAGLSRMQYSLDFLKGEKGTIYGTDNRWLSLAKGFARFLFSVWPWLAYSISSQLGQPYLAAIFLLVLLVQSVLIELYSRSRNKNRILERRVEDWVVIVGSISIALLAILPGASVWTWALATPILLLSGIKSLYDAPKELALVAF